MPTRAAAGLWHHNTLLLGLIVTHFHDLAPCLYFGEEHAGVLIAIGWLDLTHPFQTGPTSPEVYKRLEELLKDPWQPSISLGVHHCELCQFDPATSQANLFVPTRTQIFVCPDLITHYIAVHHYLPPGPFADAVMKCPDSRTIEYKKMLLASGGRSLVSWKG